MTGSHEVLTEREVSSLSALCDRVLPEGPDGPGAAEARVVNYIVNQLAGEWGQGARMYRRGPFVENATPELGWQSPMTPVEVYRSGLAALDRYAKNRFGAELSVLPADQVERVVEDWSSGQVDTFESLEPAAFFRIVKQNIVEGLFADPMYGGNHEMIGWRWLGHPGVAAAHGDDYQLNIENYGMAYEVEPRSLEWDSTS